jgi:hypothetical protein
MCVVTADAIIASLPPTSPTHYDNVPRSKGLQSYVIVERTMAEC